MTREALFASVSLADEAPPVPVPAPKSTDTARLAALAEIPVLLHKAEGLFGEAKEYPGPFDFEKPLSMRVNRGLQRLKHVRADFAKLQHNNV